MSYNRYPKEMKEAIVARFREEDLVGIVIQKRQGWELIPCIDGEMMPGTREVFQLRQV